MVSFRAAQGKAIAEAREKSQVSGPPKGFKDKPKGGKGKSLSKSAISEISDAARFAEKIGSDKTFSDLAKQYKQFNVKYDRPATFRETYGEEVNKVGTPLASTYYKDPVTGEERFFTAQAPTFGQLMGDIGRGLFSGYNTLSYDPNVGGVPTTTGGQIVRQQGLFPLLANKAMSGEFGLMGLAKGLYDRFKSGTQQGIETVGGLYNNLRKTLGGGEPPVASYGGSSDIRVTEQPMFPYNFETIMKPKPDPLLPSEMSQEQFMESYPELYSGNPLLKKQIYEPIRVSDMDMSGVVASNAGQNIIGNLQNLQNLAQQYNLNKIQFDPFNPNRIGYKDQFMYNNTPVNYNIGIGNQGVEAGLNFAFKKGGSVDKYAGLGYKLK